MRIKEMNLTYWLSYTLYVFVLACIGITVIWATLGDKIIFWLQSMFPRILFMCGASAILGLFPGIKLAQSGIKRLTWSVDSGILLRTLGLEAAFIALSLSCFLFQGTLEAATMLLFAGCSLTTLLSTILICAVIGYLWQ